MSMAANVNASTNRLGMSKSCPASVDATGHDLYISFLFNPLNKVHHEAYALSCGRPGRAGSTATP